MHLPKCQTIPLTSIVKQYTSNFGATFDSYLDFTVPINKLAQLCFFPIKEYLRSREMNPCLCVFKARLMEFIIVLPQPEF